jgi:hypothetical protein
MLANHAPASNDSPQGDSDYETILTALTESARGRSFLQEFLRRNRSADTASLLTAIGRIEELLKTRSLEPDEPQNENGTEVGNIAPADNAPLVEAASQGPTAMSGSVESELASASEALQPGMMALEVERIEIAAADVAEVDSFSVEVAESQASAVEFLGPQSKHPAEPVGHAAAPADRIKTEPRDPFADFYALSNEEKIALFA